MGVCILAKRVVLELSSSTNFVYSLRQYRCENAGIAFLRLEVSLLFYSNFIDIF